jgi:hypothetical protein
VGLLHARVYRVPCAAVCVVSRKRFPDEAPVFEVIDDRGEVLPRGAIFEGVGAYSGVFKNVHGYDQECPDGIGARVLDESQMLMSSDNRHPVDGWVGLILYSADVKPLTPAARAMLAITKAGTR